MTGVQAAAGCLVLGGGTLVNWWFEMFSDCGYAQLCRSIMSQGGFYLGRNTIALIEPAVGSMFAFGGALLLVETSGSEVSLPEAFFGGGFVWDSRRVYIATPLWRRILVDGVVRGRFDSVSSACADVSGVADGAAASAGGAGREPGPFRRAGG